MIIQPFFLAPVSCGVYYYEFVLKISVWVSPLFLLFFCGVELADYSWNFYLNCKISFRLSLSEFSWNSDFICTEI